MSEVKVGVRFQNMFQDQLLTYEVTKCVTPDMWACEVINTEPILGFGGIVHTFSTEQISLKLGLSSTMERALKGIGL